MTSSLLARSMLAASSALATQVTDCEAASNLRKRVRTDEACEVQEDTD